MTRLAVLCITLAAPFVARAGDWELSPGLSAGYRPQTGGVGAVGTLSVLYRPRDFIAAEVILGDGPFGAPLGSYSPIEIGARFLYARDGAEPFLWLAVAHAHEVPAHAWVESPVSATLAVCPCVNHRTGLALGAGTSWRLPLRWPIVAVARLTGTGFLPSPMGPTFYLGASGALAWRF